MDPDELRVREETLRKLRANPELYLVEYSSKFANVLNADDAATLFDEYNQDPAKYRVAVHTAATWIRDELFQRALAERAPEGRNRVVFTAGGNAAGKSTAISFTKDGLGAQVVFDRGAAETMCYLWRDFSKDTRFQFRFVDNSGDVPRLGNIDLAAPQDYTEIGKRLYELLDQGYRAGTIAEAGYRRIRGRGDSG
jgi:hypothetical protein